MIRAMADGLGLGELRRLELMVEQELRRVRQPTASWEAFVPFFCDALFDRSRDDDLASLGVSLHAYLTIRQRV